MKRDVKIVVGDIVEAEKETASNKFVVSKIYPRKNLLIRPTLSNLEQLFIVIAKKPKPDFYLVDKLIIYCLINDIEPYLIINKKDLFSEDEIKSITSQFKDVVSRIFIVSAKNNDTGNLLNFFKGKLSAFAGQSAVGKSTLINSIFPELDLKTNVLSAKIDRGKHTTRHSEIFIKNDIKIIDTPGFSLLDLNDIEPDELCRYYVDMEPFAEKCLYKGCTHINSTEKNCGVVKAVNAGKYNRERFERYCELYKIIKQNWEKKYD